MSAALGRESYAGIAYRDEFTDVPVLGTSPRLTDHTTNHETWLLTRS
ncbi:hypothetical protein [Streptomyces sp. x-19]